jgi:integrating conjugative element membrane protein (TIGR03747 family)
MTARQQQPERPHARGPVVWVLVVTMGLISVSLTAWFTGMMIEMVGGFFWSELGDQHATQLVRQDMDYIAAAPRSILVGDTIAFSQLLSSLVALPFEKFGILNRYESDLARRQQGALNNYKGIAKAADTLKTIGARGAVIAMRIAQDVLLRLSVALYALPAFALAILLGALDGMVRRDLRRWSGGRETSNVHHHARHYTVWALTGGFGLYLSWPLGGFNPAYMVLVFTVLVAATLSTTVATYKKYL